MPKILGFEISGGAGVRREYVWAALLVVALAGLWFFKEARTAAPASSSTASQSSTADSPGPSTQPKQVSRLHLELIRKKPGEQNDVPESRRNPFVFVKSKPKIELNPDGPVVPVKPRPTAEYQGYLLSDGKKFALIKMNNDTQIVAEGTKTQAGYLLATVDPTQIVLKDADGDSYSFMLPR